MIVKGTKLALVGHFLLKLDFSMALTTCIRFQGVHDFLFSVTSTWLRFSTLSEKRQTSWKSLRVHWTWQILQVLPFFLHDALLHEVEADNAAKPLELPIVDSRANPGTSVVFAMVPRTSSSEPCQI
jgi:hypothetical protein